MITLDEVKKHPQVIAFLAAANMYMKAAGFTEHGERHALLVSNIAYNILTHLECNQREAELTGIAGYLHDMGNMVSRSDHGSIAAILAKDILIDLKMDPSEIAVIVGAIGNHEEEVGEPVSTVCAALILGDKSDVHRSRVHNPNPHTFDIHDRVNFAAKKSFIRVDYSKKKISLELTIDTEISQVMEYFEIFLSRMVMCRKAAKILSCQFELIINETKLL